MAITVNNLAAQLADQYDITAAAARDGVGTYLGQINEIDGTRRGDDMDEAAADAIRASFEAHYGEPGERANNAALVALEDATLARESAASEWRDAIRVAREAGATGAEIAAAAGVTRARVSQILAGQ